MAITGRVVCARAACGQSRTLARYHRRVEDQQAPLEHGRGRGLVYDFVTELTTTQKVSDETFARARKIFNDQQIVDLTAVAGNYVMVAMMLAMAEETVPPGKEEPFKVGEK
jgi:4-carboxymuconolactone decarboxylase